MELNREQVVKAVAELRKRGLSDGGSLGYHAGWCDEVADLLENALAIIRELTEEKERLEKTNEKLVREVKTAHITIRELERDKEVYRKAVDAVEADTVRKMQERLKARYKLPQSNEASSISPYQLHECIDKIAKELLEEV